MGRAPCCDKASVKKGPWSGEEDRKLKEYIQAHGTGGNWIALPRKAGLKRCGKSCRLRWLNYLRPDIKHGGFSDDEDRIICTLFATIGSRWSVIAAQLPGRTDNDIKNYWNTKLKKKLLAGLHLQPPTPWPSNSNHHQQQPREYESERRQQLLFPPPPRASTDDQGGRCLPTAIALQARRLMDQGDLQLPLPASYIDIGGQAQAQAGSGRGGSQVTLCSNSPGNGNGSYLDLCSIVNNNGASADADGFGLWDCGGGREAEETVKRLLLSQPPLADQCIAAAAQHEEEQAMMEAISCVRQRQYWPS